MLLDKLYFDSLYNAIKARFNRDFAKALEETSAVDMSSPCNHVTLPMRGDVRVAYEKDLAAFSLMGTFECDKQWITEKIYFSTREIKDARDAMMLVDYLFEEAKEELKLKLAERYLEDIVNGKTPKEEK